MSRRPLVALSGATSPSGFWIARALAGRGFAVHASCPRPREAYAGRKRHIAEQLRAGAHVAFGLRAERGELAGWARSVRPDLWIHHHHWMEDYRSAAYDAERAHRVGIAPLPDLVKALREAGVRGILASGSYFEPGEGGTRADGAATPYARSKREVWDALRELAGEHGIPLAKVVIPNAIGPFEAGDRLIPSLLEAARSGAVTRLRSPGSVSDHLPFPALADTYVEVAGELLAGRPLLRRPSGAVERADAFAAVVSRELVEGRLGLPPCRIEVQSPPARPTAFRNPPGERRGVDWPAFWRSYAAWERRWGTLDRP